MRAMTRYFPELRERAVWLMFEHQSEYSSQWAAMGSIVEKIDWTQETDTLGQWVRRCEHNQGQPSLAPR